MSRLVIEWNSGWSPEWRVYLGGDCFAVFRASGPSSMDLAIRLAALCAQEISARHNIPTIDVQAPPDLAEKFRAIAKTRVLHLMTGAAK